jgi:hypothetical protein
MPGPLLDPRGMQTTKLWVPEKSYLQRGAALLHTQRTLARAGSNPHDAVSTETSVTFTPRATHFLAESNSSRHICLVFIAFQAKEVF